MRSIKEDLLIGFASGRAIINPVSDHEVEKLPAVGFARKLTALHPTVQPRVMIHPTYDHNFHLLKVHKFAFGDGT